MGRYLSTRGRSVISVAICDRCRLKVRYVELAWDRNAPGLRVCAKCNDELDRWRLPPRSIEKIAPDYPRLDSALSVPTPVADFSFTPSSGNRPIAITFTDLSTGGVDTWAWDFGDGSTSTLQNPVHSYTIGGTFTVLLTVVNAAGTSSASHPITITAVSTPVASFTSTPGSGSPPLTVAFTDTSTNSPTSWLWDFGDGGTSTLQNPSHVFSTDGTFLVTLTASNVAGSSQAQSSIEVTSATSILINFDDFSGGAGSPIGAEYALTEGVTFTEGLCGVFGTPSIGGDPCSPYSSPNMCYVQGVNSRVRFSIDAAKGIKRIKFRVGGLIGPTVTYVTTTLGGDRTFSFVGIFDYFCATSNEITIVDHPEWGVITGFVFGDTDGINRTVLIDNLELYSF